ncbi:AmmeMemoRadiSam system protein A [Pseudobutyrivibrio xylanivorans]|uniref:AmmeMemoRadiSam system protein A n=1 Tax=Pseudobutyrivibrio xylanivorans TaxID=185007 RepID=A0A5P6VPL0_PSEXY|nr:AmmeMemoRadiSam system protein A [Pseudobutyrivibrio xylanivorans]QFJ54507.1 AmmeMemoRadiSam system protein A [Pseudobutyrivibrio xylanivorans]
MSVLAAFMVPHPPLIVPAVGRGGEKEILETTRAYTQVAEEIAALKPDTIIITSPHSIMYSDYFHISPGNGATGSFANFRAPEVTFTEQYDTQLVGLICHLADKEDFPAGTLGERNPELDHGTMVPLWFIRQKYKEGRIIRIGLSGLPLTEHYHLGELIAKASNESGKRVVIVASGDLSHKLQDYGPYGFAKEGPVYDSRIMDVCGKANFGELFDFDESFCEKAAECGHRSFVIMAGAFDGLNVNATSLSHQDVTGVGYGICTFYPQDENENRHFLTAYTQKLESECIKRNEASDDYVKLARASIESWVKGRHQISVPDGLPAEMLNRAAGTFVSIHKFGRLRGCIGTIAATQDNIAEEIIHNAMSASTRDNRFDPITEKELKYLEISVDVLGPTEDIDSPDQLDVKRYGVIVSHGFKRGLLLPNLDGVDSIEQQINIARQKGGIDADEPYKLQRFEVVRHY